MGDSSTFLGRGWKFYPSFDQHSRAVEMVENENDIKESLRILFSTIPAERSMEPTYGCDLTPLAFQRLDLNLETFMVNNIKKAIADHEPRIKANEVVIETKNRLEGLISIRVEYTVKATNDRNNIVFPYYFEEGAL